MFVKVPFLWLEGLLGASKSALLIFTQSSYFNTGLWPGPFCAWKAGTPSTRVNGLTVSNAKGPQRELEPPVSQDSVFLKSEQPLRKWLRWKEKEKELEYMKEGLFQMALCLLSSICLFILIRSPLEILMWSQCQVWMIITPHKYKASSVPPIKADT